MATIPTPYDATAGTKASAAAFDAGVKDVFNFLLNGYPRVHAYDGTGVSCANSVSTLIPWSAEVYDTDSMHDNTTNPSRIIFNTTGLYQLDFQLTMPGVAYTLQDLNIRLNSGGAAAGGTSLRTQPYSDGTRGVATVAFRFQRFMTAGDYVEAFMNQTSGLARSCSATSLGTRVFANWIASS